MGIGSNPISAIMLVALLLVVVRFVSLVLETAKPKVKGRADRKEARMNGRLIVGSLLETAWAISVSVVAGALPLLP